MRQHLQSSIIKLIINKKIMYLGVGLGLQEMSWGKIFEEKFPSLHFSFLPLQNHITSPLWFMSILEALIIIFIALKNVEMENGVCTRQNIKEIKWKIFFASHQKTSRKKGRLERDQNQLSKFQSRQWAVTGGPIPAQRGAFTRPLTPHPRYSNPRYKSQ